MENIDTEKWIIDEHKLKIRNIIFWIHKIPTSRNWLLTSFDFNLTNYNLKTKDYNIAHKRAETIITSKMNYVNDAIDTLTLFTEKIKKKSVKLTPKLNKDIINFTESIKNL